MKMFQKFKDVIRSLGSAFGLARDDRKSRIQRTAVGVIGDSQRLRAGRGQSTRSLRSLGTVPWARQQTQTHRGQSTRSLRSLGTVPWARQQTQTHRGQSTRLLRSLGTVPWAWLYKFCHLDRAERVERSRPWTWIKIVSMILIFTFTLQQFSYGQLEHSRPAPVQPLIKGRVDLNQVSIPRDIAITRDINKTKSDELIINIKDVHDNYGAQKSIVSVLDNLAINYDLSFVGIEGSEGYIDTNMISAFPDAEVKKKAADSLMRQGKISAGEFFAAVSETPVKLYGIDDGDLYLKNYYAFRGLYEKKERNVRLIKDLRGALYALEDNIFSNELKSLNRNSVLSNGNGKKFTKRWYFIEKIGKSHGVKCDEYPNVNALIEAVEVETTIDYPATNVQRDKVLDILTGTLKRDRLEELILKSLSFKLGKISKSRFYSYILYLAKAEGLDRAEYDELEVFCNYVNLYESIDIGELMDEIDDYECRIKEKLFRNSDERELTTLMKNMEILDKVFTLKLTSGQLQYFRDHLDDFSW